jgi:hypothetical protein
VNTFENVAVGGDEATKVAHCEDELSSHSE